MLNFGYVLIHHCLLYAIKYGQDIYLHYRVLYFICSYDINSIHRI